MPFVAPSRIRETATGGRSGLASLVCDRSRKGRRHVAFSGAKPMNSAVLLYLTVLLAGPNAAQDDVAEYAVIVHANNPTKAVSRSELIDLMTAKKRHWSDREKVRILLPKSGTDEKEILLDKVYKRNDRELKKHWVELVYQNKISAPPPALASSRLTVATVQRKKGAIAIIKLSDLGKEPRVSTLR